MLRACHDVGKSDWNGKRWSIQLGFVYGWRLTNSLRDYQARSRQQAHPAGHGDQGREKLKGSIGASSKHKETTCSALTCE
jgi:hypothetical protein